MELDEKMPSKEELDEIELEDDSSDNGYDPEKDVPATDPVRIYLKEIGTIPMMGRDEELRMTRMAKAGDEAAKTRVAEANLRLVVRVAKKYATPARPFLDLIQDGNLGLLKAVDRFNPELGYRFSTYATWWIRQAIIRGITDMDRAIRPPAYIYDNMRKIDRTEQALMHEYGRQPTEEEISKRCGIPMDIMSITRRSLTPIVSLDKVVNEEEDAFLGDFIADENSCPEDANKELYLYDAIQFCMQSLDAREKDVLALRFGLNGNKIHTLEEVGSIYGVTRERIRQIEARALRKLRHPTKSRKLKEFL